MDIWYTENHTDNVRLSIRIDRQLASVQSEFQRIDVFDSVEFGRIMTLDGLLMVTEKDEYIYHEMITHIPMATNPNIKKVLVIGAGDGGTVRELCRYSSIEQIDMVEIDELVVHLAKEYLPFTACSLDDPRVHIYYQDGLRTYAGLIEINGSYYYVRTSGEVVHGQKYWITKTNGLMAEGGYTFADDGKMIIR